MDFSFNSPLLKKVHISIPYPLLIKKYLPYVLKYGLNVEIGLFADVLDSCTKEDIRNLASILKDHDIAVTLHGPFMDLSPGSIDQEILRVTRKRLYRFSEFIKIFSPILVTLHSGYESNRYLFVKDKWLEISCETWEQFLSWIDDISVKVAIENVFDEGPTILYELLSMIDNNRIGCCFDCGHFNVFGRAPLGLWIETLAPYIFQIHLHNNFMIADDHFSVHRGLFPIEELFLYLSKERISPLFTLEPHREEDLIPSLRYMERFFKDG